MSDRSDDFFLFYENFVRQKVCLTKKKEKDLPACKSDEISVRLCGNKRFFFIMISIKFRRLLSALLFFFQVMGIYTFTSRCVLDEFENKPKRMQVS